MARTKDDREFEESMRASIFDGWETNIPSIMRPFLMSSVDYRSQYMQDWEPIIEEKIIGWDMAKSESRSVEVRIHPTNQFEAAAHGILERMIETQERSSEMRTPTLVTIETIDELVMREIAEILKRSKETGEIEIILMMGCKFCVKSVTWHDNTIGVRFYKIVLEELTGEMSAGQAATAHELGESRFAQSVE